MRQADANVLVCQAEARNKAPEFGGLQVDCRQAWVSKNDSWDSGGIKALEA